MKLAKKLTVILLFAAAVLFFPARETNAESYKAGGDCGKDLKWSLDYNGNLYIYGTGEMTNYGTWDHNKKGWADYSSEIKTITFEKGATTIGREAFRSCNNLKTVKLPSTLTIIESEAFEDCSSLSKITLPNSLKELGSSTFEGCTSLTSINLPKGLENLGDRGYGLHTFSNTGLKSITIPSSVKKMAGYCFMNCPNLTSVTMSGTGLELSYECFMDCPKLKTVKIGNGVTCIRSDAFRNCTSLSSVTLGNDITVIWGAAFKNCTSLKEISIPDDVTALQSSVFEDCSALKTVTLGVGLTKLESDVFKNCASLKEVYFCGDAPSFGGNSTFEGCGNITGYYPKTSKTWDRSTLTSHGAQSLDWKTWTPPLNHFAAVMKNVQATAKGVKVSWNKLNGAKGYEVYRKTGNGAWQKVKTIGGGSTKSWEDNSVTNGNRYTYRIYAVNGNVLSKVSNSEYLYYLTKNTISVSSSSGKLTVSWKKNSKVSGYQISYGANANFSKASTVKVKKANNLKGVISLKRGQTYYVRMRNYKTVNGKTFYGAWSDSKKIIIR